MTAEHRQTRPRPLLGRVVLSPGAGEPCPGDERAPHLGVVLPERATPQRQRAVEQLLRLVQAAQRLRDPAERLEELGLHRGLRLERPRLTHAAV